MQTVDGALQDLLGKFDKNVSAADDSAAEPLTAKTAAAQHGTQPPGASSCQRCIVKTPHAHDDSIGAQQTKSELMNRSSEEPVDLNIPRTAEPGGSTDTRVLHSAAGTSQLSNLARQVRISDRTLGSMLRLTHEREGAAAYRLFAVNAHSRRAQHRCFSGCSKAA